MIRWLSVSSPWAVGRLTLAALTWPDPETPRWLILVALAVVLVGMYAVSHLVESLAMRFLLFASLAGLGVSLWIEREELGTCAVTCSCSLLGADVQSAADPVCEIAPLDAGLLAAEAHSLVLLNELRSDLDLGTVERAGPMDSYARDWSRQMDETDDFRHSSGPWIENLVWWRRSDVTPEEAAQRLHELWVDSPVHLANMTDPDHGEVGIGFWRSGDGWYATHVFT